MVLLHFLAGETAHNAPGKKPLDFLQNAAKCYATAVKCSSKNLQAHIGLALVMEEFFYAEDLYGLQREVLFQTLCTFLSISPCWWSLAR